MLLRICRRTFNIIVKDIVGVVGDGHPESAEAVVWRRSINKGVLKNLAKSTGKHLCRSLLFNKVAGLKPFIEHLQMLLLKVFVCTPHGPFVVKVAG